MDALLGWERRRLAPPAMPIDIGAFTKKYYKQKNLPLSKESVHELKDLHKKLGKLSNNISTVATFTDPTVNKQEMFDTLQETFLWDIYAMGTSDGVQLDDMGKIKMRKNSF
jgi:hypothetical protein